MKYRGTDSKLKQKHHVLKELEVFLERELLPMPEVQSVIPGRIAQATGKSTKGSKTKLRIRFQYNTPSGAKLIAQSAGSVQEVFVVTSSPDAIAEKISSLGF